VGPEQRGQAALVLGVEHGGPVGVGEHVLEHEGVHVDQGGLQDPQAQHGRLLLVAAVGGDVAALAIEDHAVGAVPGLHDVQTLVDLPLQESGATAVDPAPQMACCRAVKVAFAISMAMARAAWAVRYRRRT